MMQGGGRDMRIRKNGLAMFCIIACRRVYVSAVNPGVKIKLPVLSRLLVWLGSLCFDFDDACHAAAKLPCKESENPGTISVRTSGA